MVYDYLREIIIDHFLIPSSFKYNLEILFIKDSIPHNLNGPVNIRYECNGNKRVEVWYPEGQSRIINRPAVRWFNVTMDNLIGFPMLINGKWSLI